MFLLPGALHISNQHLVALEHSQVCSPGADTGQVHPGKNSEQLWPIGFSQPARESLPLGGHYGMKRIRPGKKGHRAHECAVAIAPGSLRPWRALQFQIPKALGALHPCSQQPCKTDAC